MSFIVFSQSFQTMYFINCGAPDHTRFEYGLCNKLQKTVPSRVSTTASRWKFMQFLIIMFLKPHCGLNFGFQVMVLQYKVYSLNLEQRSDICMSYRVLKNLTPISFIVFNDINMPNIKYLICKTHLKCKGKLKNPRGNVFIKQKTSLVECISIVLSLLPWIIK